MNKYEHVGEKVLSESEQRERDDMEWLVSSEQGLRIIHRILERCGVWRLSYNNDAFLMAHLEGMRSIGLSLFNAALDVSPNVLERMNKAVEGMEDV